MTVRHYWIGSVGPLTYDDSDDVNDPSGELSGPTTQHTLTTTGQLIVETAPSEDTHVVRKLELDAIGSIPSGIIVMWSGSIASIPSGWVLCDGTSGTPDLRDRFICGAGSINLDPGDTGGQDTLVLDHTHAFGSYAADSNGAHTHTADGTLATDVNAANNNNSQEVQSGTGVTVSAHTHTHSHSHDVTGNTNSNGAHTHTIAGTSANGLGGAPRDNRPVFYALAFIMKT